MILCANPKAQYDAHRVEIDRAIQTVLERGMYVLGERTRSFEAEFARYVGVAHGMGVGNGTDAIHIALRALGIGVGDEVITVSHTAVATVAAIEMAGAVPVFVDIDPVTFTMDVTKIEAAIGHRTRAIVAVHLYGQPVDLAPVLAIARQHSLQVVEDCAQAHGARLDGQRVGSMGAVGCFSFYPTKNLGGLGDGGMLVTNNVEVAERARQLREYGWVERYVSRTTGFNTRLDELQAAVLSAKLPYLDEDNRSRQRIAARYDEGLASLPLELPARRANGDHVYHLYVIRSSRRDELQRELRERGIGALVHYPVPIHLQPAYGGRLRGSDSLPVTEKAAREVLSLPLYPELSASDVATVLDVVTSIVRTAK